MDGVIWSIYLTDGLHHRNRYIAYIGQLITVDIAYDTFGSFYVRHTMMLTLHLSPNVQNDTSDAYKTKNIQVRMC